MVLPSWISDCSRRRTCRVQIPEKHKIHFQKPFWIFLCHIISSVHSTRWARVLCIQHAELGSSWFHHKIVSARELCQVSWLWMHTCRKSEDETLEMTSFREGMVTKRFKNEKITVIFYKKDLSVFYKFCDFHRKHENVQVFKNVRSQHHFNPIHQHVLTKPAKKIPKKIFLKYVFFGFRVKFRALIMCINKHHFN